MKRRSESPDCMATEWSTLDWRLGRLDESALRDKGNDLAAPPELQGTCIVEADVVHRIVGFSPSPPRSFPHKLRKVLAFIGTEGLGRTTRKVRSVLLAKRSESDEALFIVAGRLRGTSLWCAACGRQYSAQMAEMLFRQELVFPATDKADATSLLQEIVNVLKRDAKLLRTLLEFSQYSREQAPVLAVGRPHAEDTWCAKAYPVLSATSVGSNVRRSGQTRSLIQIGGGSYPYVYTLPYVKGHTLDTLVEYNPIRAKKVGRRFGFRHVETDYKRVLDRAARLERLSVVVASYHSKHADIAIDFMQANPKACVFIEKPPTVGYEQFQRLLPYIRDNDYFVEIGYNRRYTRMIRRASELVHDRKGPVVITCIIREDDMTGSHWNFWQTEGTRVYANLCHWIDLVVLLTGCRPVEIVCMAGRDFQFFSEVSIRFEDDSVANLISGVIGNGLRGVQEYIDIRTGYLTIKIDDFLKMTVLDGGGKKVYRSWPREKGHCEMYRSFCAAVVTGGRARYGLRDFVRSCTLIEEICQMLRSGERHRMIDVDQLRTWEQLDG